jgi:alanyl-tRNA synthetase
MEQVSKHFESFGFPLVIDRQVLPGEGDRSTLFVCSGMQRLKERFRHPDGTRHGSLQSCIRTNDLDLVGDGSHLTYFEMLGNFSFGGNDYETSVELWHSLMRVLKVPVTHITVHPTQERHRELWSSRGYRVVLDESCVWSDGDIGGHCCEMFVGELEIGNLVNPLGHSTDVGFGWERLNQVISGKRSVHETDLFRQDVHPIVADHLRSLLVMKESGIRPGGKLQESVCRRLVQRIIRLEQDDQKLSAIGDWVADERSRQVKRLNIGRRYWRKHCDKPPEWWKDTFGLTLEDLDALKRD